MGLLALRNIFPQRKAKFAMLGLCLYMNCPIEESRYR